MNPEAKTVGIPPARETDTTLPCETGPPVAPTMLTFVVIYSRSASTAIDVGNSSTSVTMVIGPPLVGITIIFMPLPGP